MMMKQYWRKRPGNRMLMVMTLMYPVQNWTTRMKFFGEEDEENNYYSLGGDNQDNPEENNRNNY